MRQLTRLLTIVVVSFSALLSAPRNALAVSKGCDELNNSFMDRNYAILIQSAQVYEAGEVISIRVSNLSAPARLELQIPDGTPIASIPAPGTLTYRFSARFIGAISWNVGHSSGDFDVSCGLASSGDSSETPAQPPDDRLNWQFGDLTAVLYLRADENGEAVIDAFEIGADSSGQLLCSLTRADVSGTLPSENTLLRECSPTVRWYILANGEIQANIGPDAGGNEYVLVFDHDTLQPVGRYKFSE